MKSNETLHTPGTSRLNETLKKYGSKHEIERDVKRLQFKLRSRSFCAEVDAKLAARPLHHWLTEVGCAWSDLAAGSEFTIDQSASYQSPESHGDLCMLAVSHDCAPECCT